MELQNVLVLLVSLKVLTQFEAASNRSIHVIHLLVESVQVAMQIEIRFVIVLEQRMEIHLDNALRLQLFKIFANLVLVVEIRNVTLLKIANNVTVVKDIMVILIKGVKNLNVQFAIQIHVDLMLNVLSHLMEEVCVLALTTWKETQQVLKDVRKLNVESIVTALNLKHALEIDVKIHVQDHVEEILIVVLRNIIQFASVMTEQLVILIISVIQLNRKLHLKILAIHRHVVQTKLVVFCEIKLNVHVKRVSFHHRRMDAVLSVPSTKIVLLSKHVTTRNVSIHVSKEFVESMHNVNQSIIVLFVNVIEDISEMLSLNVLNHQYVMRR
jgi:hypothetical protein